MTASTDEFPTPTHSLRWLVPSLRLRITLLAVVTFFSVQLILSTALYLYVRERREGDLDRKLHQRVTSLSIKIASTSALPSNESFAALVEDEPRSILIEDLLASLYTNKGQLLATNSVPEISFTQGGGADTAVTDAPIYRTFEIKALQLPGGRQRSGRTVAVKLADPTGRDLVLIVASGDDFVAQLTRELRQNILIAMPIGLIAACISGWLIAGIAVRPLRRLSQIAQLLSPSSLGARIDFGSTATEVSRLQERLNEARRRLDAGYRAQEQFAGNVAHELKTPLAIIVANADVVRASAGPMPAQAKQFIDVTRDEALRLARLCESFLLLTRVRHGKPVQPNAKPVMVNEWLMDCVEDSQGAAERFSVEIVPQLLEGDAGMEASLVGDRELLSTMLDNLIRNACRFSPAGGMVQVSATQTDDRRVIIAVRDQGPGVPPMMLEKIFERFVQADASEPAGRRGSGIGLAIAQGIAELHGGEIGVANQPGGGCTFSITLPLATGAAESDPAVTASASDTAPTR